ncbi:hypothetical protein MYX65_08295, partial [Acidobacteria bacterium AH-259-L09]|nr:hypothetical protein [Acidobacteria bacterium AH-259-L09]
MIRPNTYVTLGVVFVASLAAAALLPFGDTIRALSGIPAIGALFFALFQILRDQTAYEKSLALQEAQNAFSIGATSHMANVAFDRHVAFCEKYVEEMFRTLSTLFSEGPTEKALRHSDSLYRIQQKYAIWLTPDLEADLDRFESALRQIGASAHVAQYFPGDKGHIERVKKMYSVFAEVVGLEEWEGEAVTEERAVKTLIGKLRNVLGIEELTFLREAFVTQSLQSLRDAG